MESNGKTSGKLKDRLARMFRRNSCNSTSATSVTLSSGNTSSRTLLSDIARNPFRSNSSLDHRNKGHVGPTSSATTARVSVDCGGCRPNRDNFVIPKSNPIQVQPLPLKSSTRERSATRNVVFNNSSAGTGTGNGTGAGTSECPARTCLPVSPSSPVNQVASNSYRISYYLNKDGKAKIKKRLCTNAYGFSESSSSSLESDGGYGLFSSEEEGGAHKTETEALFSSKSFSSDSSEFYSKPLQSNHFSKKKRNKTKQRRRKLSGCQNCNIKQGFQPLVSAASRERKAKSGQVKKDFAVVKKSSDPYADFRNSMVEMIIEMQIFGSEDLEKLLQSYLSLNSPRHHPVILQAFSDIWVALFGN
ncbi:Transcription repressor OFP8 [Carex littledalei]|uniref:Transcription repressor n=1 Tax=Carex littledalei TaxID=544730 RepID=A0A833R2A9_9POAL|nr:Transcription repressor OFP8 [Carex littledalei]